VYTWLGEPVVQGLLFRAQVKCVWTVAYLRLIDSCITQLKAQGPSRTCNESKEEEEEEEAQVKCVWNSPQHTADYQGIS